MIEPKVGDTVEILTGKDKGQTGTVVEICSIPEAYCVELHAISLIYYLKLDEIKVINITKTAPSSIQSSSATSYKFKSGDTVKCKIDGTLGTVVGACKSSIGNFCLVNYDNSTSNMPLYTKESTLELISAAKWNIGDAVEVNGKKKKIIEYDSELGLWKTDDMLWSNGSDFFKIPSIWGDAAQSDWAWDSKCECGADKTYGSSATHLHARYCPKHKAD
jgi:hypothetical protein